MKKNTKVTTWLLYLVPVVVIVGLIIWSVSQPSSGDRVVSQGNQHIKTIDQEHIEYSTTPPTSGPHVGNIARWGIHDEQIPDEQQVHNLEDGGVIVHYDPMQIEAEKINDLRSIVSGYSDRVILEPYADLQSKIVVTAWSRIDYLDEVDGDRIKTFINKYKGLDHHVR